MLITLCNAALIQVQLANYLVATKEPVGLILNFGENKGDIKRKVKELL